jgi:7,8-dihydro-6-hydroxymethylpterin dimethyltransferase
MNAEAFDLRRVQKTCIHIAHPEGKRLIPFDTFNMFYRDDLESTRLASLRMEAVA